MVDVMQSGVWTRLRHLKVRSLLPIPYRDYRLRDIVIAGVDGIAVRFGSKLPGSMEKLSQLRMEWNPLELRLPCQALTAPTTSSF